MHPLAVVGWPLAPHCLQHAGSSLWPSLSSPVSYPACDLPSSHFPWICGWTSFSQSCVCSFNWFAACQDRPAVKTCPGKPGLTASPSTQSFASLLGSLETEIIHWGLASTSPVMQHPTLPCICSSMTLFFGCHTLAANMLVLVSPKDSPKARNKKKPLWLKTNSVAGSCPAVGCQPQATSSPRATAGLLPTVLGQQQSCCRAVAQGPCGDESRLSPHWLRSGPHLRDRLQAQGCASPQCLHRGDRQRGQAGCEDQAVPQIPLPHRSQPSSQRTLPGLFYPRPQNC